MKIRIDKDMPHLTNEEQEEIKSIAVSADENPEAFQKAMLGTKEIVLSTQVAEQLEKMGISPDELIAMMLKSAKATQ